MSAQNPAAVKTLNASSAATWMERLRAKASNYRSASDLSRAVRTTLLDRRTAPDAADRQLLRASLDQLAHAVPARDASSLADRIDSISKQVAARWTKRGVGTLKFMGAPVHGCYYLTTESFYVEINFEGSSGRIVEAKVHHVDSNNQQSSTAKNCPEMINCLSKGDFAKFIDHLEGLMAIYDVPNASAQDKTRGWNSLSLLESDLIRFDSLNRFDAGEDLSRVINTSPLGLVQPRAGGLPLRITYFITPQDKIDVASKSMRTLTAATIFEDSLGVSATVCLERSEQARALPIHPLISPVDGKEIPMTADNSILLPAGFVLQLDQPLPLEVNKYQEILGITGLDFVQEAASQQAPLLQLITKSASNNNLDSSNNRGLFVSLPDQNQCYFLNDHDCLKGFMVKKIPFSHPAHVARIVAVLRKQAIFNAIISSCVRNSGIQDLEKAILFEVSCMDIDQLCVTFEMGHDNSSSSAAGQIATFQLDFSDLHNAQTKVHKLSMDNGGDSNMSDVYQGSRLAKNIFDKSLSLPLTMRALTKQLTKSKTKIEPASVSSSSAAVGMDFSAFGAGSSYLYKNGGNSLENGNAPPTLKSEPMDFDDTDNRDHLNASRPQDAALIPGAKSKTDSTKSTATPLIKVIKSEPTQQQQSSSSKLPSSLEIKPFKGAAKNTTLMTAPSTKSSPTSKNNRMSDIKPLVSITPVSQSTATVDSLSLKKPATGFEIIPLGDKLPSSGHNKYATNSINDSKSKLKDIKRSLSEDDAKRRLAEKSKKRKRDHFLNNSSSSKHGSSPTSKKLTSVIDRLSSSSSHNDSGIEIIPTSSSAVKYDKDKLKSLKLTIKSGSGSSKHRDHKSSSKHSSSSSKHKRPSPTSSSSSSKIAAKIQRDKDRIEEVKRLIGSNKLDTTTFQIPKRTKPPDAASGNSGTSPKSYPSSPLKSSPKLTPPDISPKGTPPVLSPSKTSYNLPGPPNSSLRSSPPSPNLAAQTAAATGSSSCDKDTISVGMNNSK